MYTSKIPYDVKYTKTYPDIVCIPVYRYKTSVFCENEILILN